MCHISSSKGCEYIKIRGKKIAVVVGEDIKTEQEYGEYADLIVNLTRSPYSRGVVEKRYDFYRQLAFMTGKTILYVNSVGGQTDIVYDGSSAAFNSRGEAIALLKSFEEDFQTVDVDGNETPKKIPEQNKTYNVYRAIKLGLGDFFVKNGFKTACLGLSGGIDSAVVLSMAAETLGPENIRVLLMPSQFSSDHSVEDARELAEKALDGVSYEILGSSQPRYECDCSRERIERALLSMGEAELNDMIAQQHGAQVGCQFCNRKYDFTEDELRALIREGKGE